MGTIDTRNYVGLTLINRYDLHLSKTRILEVLKMIDKTNDNYTSRIVRERLEDALQHLNNNN